VETERIDLLISEVIEEINGRFEDEIPSRVIGEIIMQKLQTVDQIAYVRFASVYRDFRDIDELARVIDQLRKGGRVP
jgi:transcriptional repressor NrdR